jgi:hypothetical protein
VLLGTVDDDAGNGMVDDLEIDGHLDGSLSEKRRDE